MAVMVMFRKLMASAIMILASPAGVLVQSQLIMMVFIWSMAIQIYARPYIIEVRGRGRDRDRGRARARARDGASGSGRGRGRGT